MTVVEDGEAAVAASAEHRLRRDPHGRADAGDGRPGGDGQYPRAGARTGKHVPIMALTAHAMKGDRERCLEAGMDAYVAKPVQKQELLHIIYQYSTPPSAGV